MRDEPELVSADGHVVELPEVFAPVAKRLGREAPRLIETEDRGLVLDTGLGVVCQPGRYASAGLSPRTPEYLEQERSGYARESLQHVEARLADMDRDGVRAEIVFPTIVARCLGDPDVGEVARSALAASYNDWVGELCTGSGGRMFPIACLSLADPATAIAEVERARSAGHVGVLLPSGLPDGRAWSEPALDRLWAAAQAEQLPVIFHGSFMPERGSRSRVLDRHGLGYTLLPIDAMMIVTDLVLGGVCERYPDLRFVLAEFDAGWIASFLDRSERQHRRKAAPETRHIDIRETWMRSFRVTFEDDAIGLRTREEIGVHTLLWASDYPHGNSTWPRSRAVLEELTADCTPEERRAVTAGNAIDLYRLPIEP